MWSSCAFRPRFLGAALVLAFAGALYADQRASEVFARAGASVVTVIQHVDSNVLGIGSGIVVGDGKVSTNYHVVAGGAEIVVHYQGERYSAEIERYAEPQDLALLSVAGLRAPTVRFGRSKGLAVGQTVYAIGSPRGLELTLSEGIVSALRGNGVIQMTTPISPGSSGGGLFDEQGRLIGVPTLQFREAQNLNFAAPVEWLTALGVDITQPETRLPPRPAPPAPPVPTTAAPAIAPVPDVAVQAQPAPAPRSAAAPAPALEVQPAKPPESTSYLPWVVLLGALLLAGWWWLRAPPRDPGAPAPAIDHKLAPFEKIARQELTANQADQDLWLQALQRSGGSETAAKVAYIRQRAEQLYRRDLDQRWAQAVAQSGAARTGPGEPPQVSKP